MIGWKKFVLMAAGFGGGFAVVIASMVGVWVWYHGRPTKPKPLDAKAILATYQYPDIESGEFEGPNGTRIDTIVVYYTLENTTDVDYHMPPQDQLEVDGRLKLEKSLTLPLTSSRGSSLLKLDEEQVFIPAKQRRWFVVHLNNWVLPKRFGPSEEHSKRRKLIEDYMKKEFYDFDGFVVFDSANRYEIDLPSGWANIDQK
jgi:hypothetical protein